MDPLKVHRVLLECKKLKCLYDRVGPPSKAKSRDAILELQRVQCAWRAPKRAIGVHDASSVNSGNAYLRAKWMTDG